MSIRETEGEFSFNNFAGATPQEQTSCNEKGREFRLTDLGIIMRTIAHYIVSILLLLSLIVLVPLSEAAKTRSIIYVKSDNISHIVLQERLDL